VKVRASGGVYFVGRQHAPTLAALRELVSRFGNKSAITRIPLPDQEEMRSMVIDGFVNQTDEAIRRLDHDIRDANAAEATEATEATIKGLHRRYRELQASAKEHEQLLGSSIEDAHASMDVLRQRLARLMDAN
jgi:hypothetical protein